MDENILKKVWPEWRVVRVLGRGSYGTVYEAERTDGTISARSAVKVISVPKDRTEVDSLRSEGMTEENAKSYFQQVVNEFVREISIMESFKGVQNIVSVEDYKVIEKKNTIGWDIYIRMELLTPFNAYLTDHVMSEQDIIKLGIDMCTALELCEKRNVIHRDIKPENIFINSFGDFKLGDFGIARTLENVSGGLSMKGTFFYMAPEVERGIPYDARVDIYSLGLVLYRLANNNRLPFLFNDQQAASPNERQEAVRRRLSGEQIPLPSGVSGILGQIILCACNYDPDRRFLTATAMKNALIAAKNNVAAAAASGAAYGAAYGGNAQAAYASSSAEAVRSRSAAIRQTGSSDGSSGKPPRKSGNILIPIIAIAVAAVLVIAAAIIVVPRILSNGDDSKKTASVTTETTAETTSQTEETASTETQTTTETTTQQQTTTQQTTTETTTQQTTTQQTTTETTTQQQTQSTVEMTTGSAEETSAANADDYAQSPKYSSDSLVISIPDLEPGDVVQLGSYEQDNDLTNGTEPIEWITLYEENGAYLLISRYCLDAKPYDTYGTCSSWDNCTLRSWLNNDFYNAAFSTSEKNIVTRSAKTNDLVSLLGYDSSGDSGVTYFLTSESSRACYATAYAIASGAWVTDTNLHSPWWLRHMDGSSNAYMVKSTGEIGSNVVNNGASSEDVAAHTLVTVRPIIWIKQ